MVFSAFIIKGWMGKDATDIVNGVWTKKSEEAKVSKRKTEL